MAIPGWALVRDAHPSAVGAASVVAVGVVYLVLLAAAVGPLDGLWATDQGIKRLQIESLVRGRFASAAVPDPAAPLDSGRQFTPLRGAFVVREGKSFGMYSESFAVLEAFPFSLLGDAGLYLLPAGSSLILLALVFSLARALAGKGFAVLSVLLVGLGSPVLFYSLVLWEHTPAALLVMLGLYAAGREMTAREPRWALLAGLAAGAAVWMRVEAALVGPAMGVALFGSRSRPPIRTLVWLVAGLMAALLPWLALNQAIYGLPLGPHVAAMQMGSAPTEYREHLNAPFEWLGTAVLPADSAPLLAAVGALLGIRCFQRWSAASGAFPWTGAASAWVLAVAGVIVFFQLGLRFGSSLLLHFPAALLCLLTPPGLAAGGTTVVRSGSDPLLGTFLARFGAVFLALAFLVQIPAGGSQWGPRMLLPVIPPLAVSGVWRASGRLRCRSWRRPHAAALAVAIILLCGWGLRLAAYGVRVLRATNQASHALAEAAAHSGAQAVVVAADVPAALLATVFYRGQPILQPGSAAELPRLLSQLQRHGIKSFFYLGRRSLESEIAGDALPPLKIETMGTRPWFGQFTGALVHLSEPHGSASGGRQP